MMERPDRWCEPLWRLQHRAANDARRPLPSLAWVGISIAVAIAVVVIIALYAPPARAQTVRAQTVRFECADLASIIAGAADFRDAGADIEKTLLVMRRVYSDADAEHLAVVEREVRRLWREKLRRLATIAVYNRCRQQLGDMGRDG